MAQNDAVESHCQAMAASAEKAMELRQEGYTLDFTIGLYSIAFKGSAKAGAIEIVNIAYETPRYIEGAMRDSAINGFRDSVYEQCIEANIND